MFTREQLLEIVKTNPEALVDIVLALQDQVVVLQQQVRILTARVSELEARLAKNSRNSNKPPSSDAPYDKPSPKSLRPKSSRPSGGQAGHPGDTLKQVKNPDHVVVHDVKECKHCGISLAEKKPDSVETRQEFDIPPGKFEVTEHQCYEKGCPNCGQINKGEFPEGVNAPVQYGPRLKALSVYLTGYQLLPLKRASELLADIFSWHVSQGTLVNIIKSCSDLLAGPVEHIRERLKSAPVAHFDETGVSVNGKNWWLHVAGDTACTYYAAHLKRGSEAMDEIGILPVFAGRAIHDCWSAYCKYGCRHGLCCAHILRELIFLLEEQDQRWAARMKKCLLDMKKAVAKGKAAGYAHLSGKRLRKFEARYRRILRAGYEENPLPGQPARRKRGRPAQTKPVNLLDRLRNHQESVLAFLNDFTMPFDNNLAERDIRMMKVKLKISGTFRSENGLKDFCRIRSYISTARKNAINAINAIADAFCGKPFMPPPLKLLQNTS